MLVVQMFDGACEVKGLCFGTSQMGIPCSLFG